MDTKRRSKADEIANTSTAVPEMQDKESQTPLEAAPEAVHSSRNDEHHVSGSISRLTTGVVDTVTDTANTMIHGVAALAAMQLAPRRTLSPMWYQVLTIYLGRHSAVALPDALSRRKIYLQMKTLNAVPSKAI